MQINIQISDELIHQLGAVSTPSVTVDTRSSPYSITDAMSGGAGPEVAGETPVSPGQVPYDALSAGSAEQQIAPVAPSAAGQANKDGGPAPS